jgi:hypothetical protein
MRRLNFALLASAQLVGAAVRQQSFSPHDDLVAYPQVRIATPIHLPWHKLTLWFAV